MSITTLRRNGFGLRAGLIAIFAIIAAGGAATAGGIGISMGKLTPVNDPEYIYSFELTLGAGDTLTQGGFITVYDLAGVSLGTGTTQPNQYWGETEQLLGVNAPGYTPSVDNPNLTNVTWYYNGPALTNTGSSPLDLGVFTVGPTVVDFTPPPSSPVDYSATVNGTTSNNGQVTVAVVPEPTSIVLFFCGMGLVAPVANRAAKKLRLSRDQY